MARYIELTIEQGATFVSKFIVKDFDGNAVNLTGYAPNAQMARDYYQHEPYSTALSERVVPFLTTVTDAVNGEITISMSSSATRLLRPEKYVWECEIVPIGSPSSRQRVAEGIVLVKARAMQTP